MEFKDILRDLRQKRRITGQEMAKILGVATSTYVSYETRGSQPPFDVLCKMADFFGVSIDYLLGHITSPYQPILDGGYCIKKKDTDIGQENFIVYNPFLGDAETSSEKYLLSRKRMQGVCDWAEKQKQHHQDVVAAGVSVLIKLVGKAEGEDTDED